MKRLPIFLLLGLPSLALARLPDGPARATAPSSRTAPSRETAPARPAVPVKRAEPVTPTRNQGENAPFPQPLYHPAEEAVKSSSVSARKPGPWRLRGGLGFGWWWGNLTDKEREHADAILVNLGSGDYEKLKIQHIVVGPFISASRAVRPWLSTGVRMQELFVDQRTNLPKDFDNSSGLVWTNFSIQPILTFYPFKESRVVPYVELGYGLAWGTWNAYTAANQVPPTESTGSYGASGELAALGWGWEYFKSPRTGWGVDFRYNVGNFNVAGIPEAQYNGHFTVTIFGVWRP